MGRLSRESIVYLPAANVTTALYARPGTILARMEALPRMKNKTEQHLPAFRYHMAQGERLPGRIYEVLLAAAAFLIGLIVGLSIAGLL
jgi:hypothetical protein